MPRFIALFIAVSLSFSTFAQVDEKMKRLDAIHYGIESQLLDLLNILISEKNDDFNAELVLLLDSSKSPKSKSALLDFFAQRNYSEVQDNAFSFIKNRDNEAEAVVLSAFNYLITIKSKAAGTEIKEIILNKEIKYLGPAIKLLSFSGIEDDANLLIEMFKDEDTSMPVKQEIILALGTLRYKSAIELFDTILKSETSTKTEKMYACAALGKIEDDGAIPLLINASVLDDPNVRASAILSLENYRGDIVERVILESMKDSHVAPRLAAVSASAKLRMAKAIPYLKYKAQSDPEKAVKDMAIYALGEIGTDEADVFLTDYLLDAKKALQHRLKAFRVLVEKDFSKSKAACMKVFTESSVQKDRALYSALAKVCTASESVNFAPYIKILLGDKDFNYRLGALLWIERNRVKDLSASVKNLSENDPIEAVKKKAALILEKLTR